MGQEEEREDSKAARIHRTTDGKKERAYFRECEELSYSAQIRPRVSVPDAKYAVNLRSNGTAGKRVWRMQLERVWKEQEKRVQRVRGKRVWKVRCAGIL